MGGLVLTSGVTNANFYSMVEIATTISGPFSLQDDSGEELPRNDQPLARGNYFIVADGEVALNPEQVHPRVPSVSSGSRGRYFRDAVFERDGRCVVTKRVNKAAAINSWSSFQAAHIFPLAREGEWAAGGFDDLITLPPPTGSKINSVQNGLLLDTGLHECFDQYLFSINPDVSCLFYKH